MIDNLSTKDQVVIKSPKNDYLRGTVTKKTTTTIHVFLEETKEKKIFNKWGEERGTDKWSRFYWQIVSLRTSLLSPMKLATWDHIDGLNKKVKEANDYRRLIEKMQNVDWAHLSLDQLQKVDELIESFKEE